MYKVTLILCFFIVGLATAFGKETEENLLRRLASARGKEKLETLHLLQQNFLYESKDWYYNDLLQDEAIRQNDIRYQSLAWVNKVAYHYRFFDTDSFFHYAEIAENFAERHQQGNDFFTIKQLLVHRCLEQGHYGLGLKKAMEMNAKAVEVDCPQARIKSLLSVAKSYQSFARYEDALKFLDEAVRIYDSKIEACYAVLECYACQATIYHDLGKYEQLATTNSLLKDGIEEIGRKQPKFNLVDFELLAMLFDVELDVARGNLQHIEEEFELIESRLEKQDMPFLDYRLKEIKMFYNQQIGNDRQIWEYYQECIEYTLKNNLEQEVRRLMTFAGKTLNDLGAYREAAKEYEELIFRMDSVNRDRFLFEINQLRMDYELDKKEDEIDRQKNELRLRTRLNFVSGFLFILLLVICIIVWRNYIQMKKKNFRLFNQIKELTETKAKLQKFKECIRERFGMGEGTCQDAQDPLFEKIESFMNTEKPYINSDYGRRNLVNDMLTNETYLSRAIRSATDMTILEYINDRRLQHAKEMLLSNRDLTVEAIAFDSGFTSDRTFYRLFKETFGMSPSAFRSYIEESYSS